MTSVSIKDIKKFMSDLLIGESFDIFNVKDVDIMTFANYRIDGSVNRQYYTDEDYENLSDKEYVFWKSVKPFVLSVIKGNKLPTYMKLTLLCPANKLTDFDAYTSNNELASAVSRLVINIRFENETLNVVTGVSYKGFTLDKSLENQWDGYIEEFLSKYE